MTALEELLRQVWTNVMEGHHDTKTSEQLETELDDFINNMEDQLKLFSTQNVRLSLPTDADIEYEAETQNMRSCMFDEESFIDGAKWCRKTTEELSK